MTAAAAATHVLLWRLSQAPGLHNVSGSGGWWAPDAGVVLLDESPLAAICARMALVEAGHVDELPRGYQLLGVSVPVVALLQSTPPPAWRTDRQAARAFVQAWLSCGVSPLLQVPTLGGGVQYLLNPAHAGAGSCQVVSRCMAPFTPHAEALGEVLAGAAWLATTPESVRAAG